MKPLLYLFGIALLGSVHGDDDLTVETKVGKLRGKYTTFQERRVKEFLGVPYAKPPVGELRFQPPLPLDPWSGTYEATEISKRCPQLDLKLPDQFSYFSSRKEQSEDCLYLNIWVPEEKSESKRPVLVLIHGGGFVFGSTDELMHSALPMAAIGNVITVSMNYRLGIFGFLNADVPAAPGNQGLLDQNLALQWVKQNIEYFGGDSSRVTIYGESAGSMSVSAHVVSPLSKELFQRAIMLGGSIVSPAVLQNAQKNIIKGNKVAALLGCSSQGDLITRTSEVLDCLRSKDIKELLLAQSEISPTWVDTFLPTYGDSFMPTNPLGTEDFSTVDAELIVGTSRNEGSLFLFPKNASMMFVTPDVNTREEAVRLALDALDDFQVPLTEEDLGVYFDSLHSASPEDLLKAVVDIVGDVVFVCPSVRLAEQHASNGNEVYFYNFGRNSKKAIRPPWMGVTHATDFMFMNGVPLSVNEMYSDEDRELSRILIKGAVHFAATGKIPTLKSVQWKLFNSVKQLYLAVNPEDVTLNSKPRGTFCSSLKNKI